MRHALRTLFLISLGACRRETTNPSPDPRPHASAAPSVSAVVSASASASAGDAPPPAPVAMIDAGAFSENTSAFAGATVTPLPIELLPHDQRKREDKKPGFTRIARVAHASQAGLGLFGLVTATNSEGTSATDQWFVRSKAAQPLKTTAGGAISFARYDGRNAPDPHPSLLVLEDAARDPIAVRFVGESFEVREVELFDGAPAFFVRRLGGSSGIDDPIYLDVVAYVGSELASLLDVHLGFRDVSPCPNGKTYETLGPPGSVTIKTTGATPVLHVREAAADCDSPAKVDAGCSGTERDYVWDGTRFVPQGAATKVTLAANRKHC